MGRGIIGVKNKLPTSINHKSHTVMSVKTPIMPDVFRKRNKQINTITQYGICKCISRFKDWFAHYISV